MSNLDELKNQWENSFAKPATFDESALYRMIKGRVNKQRNTAMQYFWASFVLQIIVYSLLSHVLVTSWRDTQMVIYCIGGILIYVPFTIVLMKKFKRMAICKIDGMSLTNIHDYINNQRKLLESFFIFKKQYELILIPLSSAIGVIIVFKLYVPGGIEGHILGAFFTYVLTLFSCYLAIRSENRKNFKRPLIELEKMLNEYK